MSKADKAAPDAATKKGGKKTLLLGGGALLLIAAGVGGGLAASGMIGGAQAAPDHKPKLVKKGEHDDYAPKTKDDKGADGGSDYASPGGDPYRLAYYQFADEFTSNLAGSGRFVQMSLALSTRYDGRVLGWIKKHEIAIRSEVLMELAATPEEQVATIEGKKALAKRLSAAVNRVLLAEEGFGGIHDAHYRSFIVQ